MNHLQQRLPINQVVSVDHVHLKSVVTFYVTNPQRYFIMKNEIAYNRYKGLIGSRFDKIVIVDVLGRVQGLHGVQVLCKCDCGRTVPLEVARIRQGQIHSCGQCGYRDEKIREACMIDMTGVRSGKLVVQYFTGRSTDKGNLIWHCKCDCGNECDVPQWEIRCGNKQSCGKCGYAIEKMKERSQKYFTPDEQRLAKVFSGMYGRCYNPNDGNFHRYGARGIYICNEWLGNIPRFVKWAIDNGYKPGLTIERIDVNGPYSPGNCRFATYSEQSKNKTNNINITIDGKTLVLKDWAREIGISYWTLCSVYYRHGIEGVIEYVRKRRSLGGNNGVQRIRIA